MPYDTKHVVIRYIITEQSSSYKIPSIVKPAEISRMCYILIISFEIYPAHRRYDLNMANTINNILIIN